MRRFLYILFLGMLISRPAFAQPLDQIFSNANQAYFKGDFNAAISHYQKLVQSGVDDANVYYNLATAYARAKKYGWAILFFERSLKIQPSDPAAEAGLSACRTILGKEQAEEQGEAMVQTKPSLSQALVRPFSQDVLAWLLLLFNLTFFSALMGYRRFSRESIRIGLGIAAPLLGLLFLITLGAFIQKSDVLEEGDRAIVVSKKPSLREGPDPRATIRAEAREGQSVRILSREGGYARIRLSNGDEGWIKRDDIGTL